MVLQPKKRKQTHKTLDFFNNNKKVTILTIKNFVAPTRVVEATTEQIGLAQKRPPKTFFMADIGHIIRTKGFRHQKA